MSDADQGGRSDGFQRRFPSDSDWQTLPDPWVEVDLDRAMRLEQELVGEVVVGHELCGRRLRVTRSAQAVTTSSA